MDETEEVQEMRNSKMQQLLEQGVSQIRNKKKCTEWCRVIVSAIVGLIGAIFGIIYSVSCYLSYLSILTAAGLVLIFMPIMMTILNTNGKLFYFMGVLISFFGMVVLADSCDLLRKQYYTFDDHDFYTNYCFAKHEYVRYLTQGTVQVGLMAQCIMFMIHTLIYFDRYWELQEQTAPLWVRKVAKFVKLEWGCDDQ